MPKLSESQILYYREKDIWRRAYAARETSPGTSVYQWFRFLGGVPALHLELPVTDTARRP